jgi:hypothetical protein
VDSTFLGEAAKLVVAAFVGALLSGWATYAIERRLQSDETTARRAALLDALRTELTAIPDKYADPPRYDDKQMHFRDAIQLVTPTMLVDGSVLDYKHDARLLAALLNLQVMVNRHNEIVRTIQLVQASLLAEGRTENELVSNKALYDAIKPRFEDVQAGLRRLNDALAEHERSRKQSHRRWRERAAGGAIVMIVVAVLLAAWSLRN